MKATAIIVTHNRVEKLKNTISATVTAGFNYVVIVNCDSNDGTYEYLSTISDRHFHIINCDNIGGAGGFAKGTKYILDNIDTDWVVFFDDDAYPSEYFLEQLSQLGGNKFQGFSAHVCSKDERLPMMNRQVIQYPDTTKKLFNYLFKKESSIVSECHLDGNIYPIESASFVGFVLSLDVLRQYHSLINPDLFIYYDDTFFTRSLTKRGFKIAFTSRLSFVHDVGPASDMPPWKIYFLSRNFFITKPLCTSFSFYSMLVMKCGKIVFNILKCSGVFPKVRAFLLGLKDGFSSNYNRFDKTSIIDGLNRFINS
ncbi:glycosyltransferase [Photobacterium sp. ZSDE20]|uniref:Glycosyltransferase n=1 Tax=Photobacterium pectinilyticum TaxID=2906793 RepID=A0ABT1N531_9GAMM|nr:glycosyltransferase [Photobacterium sp. ZSDE20]MCQ1058344.1 glycosyltransferase [Photobacterium sp. ZSDE20]MDD1823139.1 glycosyltransferase [Photobacterium sp. ZSDE20]